MWVRGEKRGGGPHFPFSFPETETTTRFINIVSGPTGVWSWKMPCASLNSKQCFTRAWTLRCKCVCILPRQREDYWCLFWSWSPWWWSHRRPSQWGSAALPAASGPPERAHGPTGTVTRCSISRYTQRMAVCSGIMENCHNITYIHIQRVETVLNSTTRLPYDTICFSLGILKGA